VAAAALIVFSVGALAGAILAARSPATTWPAWILAVVLGLELVWIVLYARGEDTYFFPDHVTRWEFAGRDGHQWIVVAAAVVAGAALVTLLWGAGRRKVAVLRAGYGGVAVSSLLLFAATFVLSVGH
jgi:hypothetical protein